MITPSHYEDYICTPQKEEMSRVLAAIKARNSGIKSKMIEDASLKLY
jgi:hypothetical protein